MAVIKEVSKIEVKFVRRTYALYYLQRGVGKQVSEVSAGVGVMLASSG